MSSFLNEDYKVDSPNYVEMGDTSIALYNYQTTKVEGNKVTPIDQKFLFKTERKVPHVGLMLVGWGGNNGSTVTAGILANKHNIGWTTKEGKRNPDYYGSLTQASTVRLGLNEDGESVHTPFNNMLPMVSPNDLVIGGWDISKMNLKDSMERAQVLDYDLQRQLGPHMQGLVPLPSIYSKDFIAANQEGRADNLISGSKQQQLEVLRQNIRDFKSSNSLDKVIVLWTANTERFCDVVTGVNDTSENLIAAIARNDHEISPSSLFAVASILEGVSYINGSPQNTFVPGVMELAEKRNTFICGDDFKSGQTKMKSVLVDFLISAGIKPTSIVSYNHLGNNDGKNLSAPEQFRSKEISKSNVVDDMVDSNRILFKEGEKPDHCVVIKYVPYVSDSKRAMDEYTSEIFMGGRNTIVMHNTCEDSLLATPIIIDLVILTEICERITVCKSPSNNTSLSDSINAVAEIGNNTAGPVFEKFHSVLSVVSYLLKAPLAPANTPVVNALAAQRLSIINIFRACCGLNPDNHMLLEHKLPSLIRMLSSREDANGKDMTNTDSDQDHKSCTTTETSAGDIDAHRSKRKREERGN